MLSYAAPEPPKERSLTLVAESVQIDDPQEQVFDGNVGQMPACEQVKFEVHSRGEGRSHSNGDSEMEVLAPEHPPSQRPGADPSGEETGFRADVTEPSCKPHLNIARAKSSAGSASASPVALSRGKSEASSTSKVGAGGDQGELDPGLLLQKHSPPKDSPKELELVGKRETSTPPE